MMAITSVAGLGDFGLSSSAVKFVAEYVALGENGAISEVIQTSVVSIAVFVAAVLTIIYFFARAYLGFFMQPQEMLIAFSLLPFLLASALFSVVGRIQVSTAINASM